MSLLIPTPRWALPLLEPKRFKGAKGGRGSGKSHFFAERVIEEMVCDPSTSVVCIREIQKSLKFSAYTLLKKKIRALNVGRFFDITNTEIRRANGSGVCIFQGMQDHTADSIKSLEDFDIAWVEEAQSLSHRSLKLLRPTIRKTRADGTSSELWFSWNPDQPDDAVDKFFHDLQGSDERYALVHVNYMDNPFLPDTLYEEMLGDRERYPEDFDHIWLGEYNIRSEARVFHNWRVGELDETLMDGPYYGADWGFSQDPTVLLRGYIDLEQRVIYITDEISQVGVETDDIPAFFDKVPGSRDHKIRADSARPETISYVARRGFDIVGVDKPKGSVESGVNWLKGYEIVVHPSCTATAKELRLYSYKTNRAGDVLPRLEDANNHCIDSMRYMFQPLIGQSRSWFMA